MTHKLSDAADDDIGDQLRMPPIGEDNSDADAMSVESTAKKGSDLGKNEFSMSPTHIVLQFGSSNNKTAISKLHQEVTNMIFDTDPGCYFHTANSKATPIKKMEDFPLSASKYTQCFQPSSTANGGAMLIGCMLYSSVSVEQMKKENSGLMSFLKANNIGLKTSCAGTTNETTIIALFGFNTEKTSRDRLQLDLVARLSNVSLLPAEKRLLEKATLRHSFVGKIPPFQLDTRWLKDSPSKGRLFKTRSLSILCATPHADFLRALIMRSYTSKLILGLGRPYPLGKGSSNLHVAIAWNNKFVKNCNILMLNNVSQAAMDQPFQRKSSTSTVESTTIRQILVNEGKAVNITESKDVELDGRWIVALEADQTPYSPALLLAQSIDCLRTAKSCRATCFQAKKLP